MIDFCSQPEPIFIPFKQLLPHHFPFTRSEVAWPVILNVMMCFEGGAHNSISPEQLFAVRAKQIEALHLALSGYRVKEFLANPIGANTKQWMLDAGGRLRRDYSNYFQKHHLRKPESWQWPLLVGLTRQEAFAHPGSNLSALFVYTPPRFRFNRSQRVLLRHALMGETCEQLAASLSISAWTVKKRWQAIYDRVTDIDFDLLPPPIAYGPHASSRGTERRRPLLNYLRQHFEELRPFEELAQTNGFGSCGASKGQCGRARDAARKFPK